MGKAMLFSVRSGDVNINSWYFPIMSDYAKALDTKIVMMLPHRKPLPYQVYGQ